MDLSELIGAGAGGSTLNEDLAAANPAGDMVFSTPFGASTAFRTPHGGALRVAFVFDPHAPYDETAILASIHQEYMDEMREALAKQLLKPEELAPRKATEEEVVWETIKKALPAKVLASNFFSDSATLSKYVELIKSRAAAAYKEEVLLGDRLRTESFQFMFKIAIDAFYNKNVVGSHERKGVLTFRIDGGEYALRILALTSSGSFSGGVNLPTPSAAADKGDGKGDGKSDGRADKSPKPHRRLDQLTTAESGRTRSASQIQREDNKEFAQLCEKLHIQDADGVTIKCEKDFPEATDEFFDSITRWFKTVITTRGLLIEHKNDSNPLYQ